MTEPSSSARARELLAAKEAVLRAWSAFHHLDIPERETLAAAAVMALKPASTKPSDEKVTVGHVTYNVGTLDSLDFNLRNCLPEHRDALLDARQRLHPDAPTEGWG